MATSDKISKLEARKKQIDERLARAKKRQAKAARAVEDRRRFLIGDSVVQAAAEDPEVRRWLGELLDRSVVREHDRGVCAAFLPARSDQSGGNPPAGESRD